MTRMEVGAVSYYSYTKEPPKPETLTVLNCTCPWFASTVRAMEKTPPKKVSEDALGDPKP